MLSLILVTPPNPNELLEQQLYRQNEKKNQTKKTEHEFYFLFLSLFGGLRHAQKPCLHIPSDMTLLLCYNESRQL